MVRRSGKDFNHKDLEGPLKEQKFTIEPFPRVVRFKENSTAGCTDAFGECFITEQSYIGA